MHRTLRCILLLLPLALAACTKKLSDDPAMIDKATFAPALDVQISAFTKTPTGLYYRDLVVGTGAEAIVGKEVGVHYAGALTNGREFDSTGKNAAPFTFQLGVGQVIAGWDQGVAGMKVGGKRQLLIPAELGYGAAGIGPIPGNAILVFTVELLTVR